MGNTDKPILFHYAASIFSHRVLWYLWLRNIDYDECIQPPYMPRPDLSLLGVAYRRIPVMAIGRDVYCDSRLIIDTLESIYPGGALSVKTPSEEGTRRLLQNYTIDGGIFANAVKCIPYWMPGGLLQDSKFLDDRASLMGGMRMTSGLMEKGRGQGLQHLRQAFDIMENTFLKDGRRWILGDRGPTVADIDAIWPFEWLILDTAMTDSLRGGGISEEAFPRTFAWVKRFMNAVSEAKKKSAIAQRLNGKQVEERLQMSTTRTPVKAGIVENDALGLQENDEVEVSPSDYGQSHKDRGRLVALTTSEVVIRNSKGYQVHFPRWNFQISRVIPPQVKSPVPLAEGKKIPPMKLFYHHASPYTRKVFMLALEYGLESHITLHKVVVCPIPYPGWSDNNEEVAAFNPLAKIPCLVTADVPDGIFDSRVICEYLDDLIDVKRKKDTRYFQQRALHACADGIMDAAVLIVYEHRIREERGVKLDVWLEGQLLKIQRGLDRLEKAVMEGVLGDPPSGRANMDEVSVLVAIGMLDQMSIAWSERRPKLVEWYNRWRLRRSFQLTPPDKEWRAGVGTKADAKM
ncbi:hypothetical protein BU24DRAFT_23557 [Aaosphaeria arxii CBS 175.79]|uniref:GST N-terminal domain-containing protein n=1 Tax=Aaosphaeria arxii CBS 175.79 TaxID=1450172 RepID=A0A6A5YAJ0_9PLEO|nr:uncharacterized protein BU24DRAFT_23557 [Aaosphaeria arxii CBS 175.79]KAF2021604.1 hypothetical protein BU24DRAFT_23557 [Aaosphaeria arxii CBS 175.79]